MTESPGTSSGENRDVVGRLLDVGGPRVSPPDAVVDRVREAVHAEWQRSLRARRARRWILAVGLPAAATLVIAVAVTVLTRPEGAAPPPGGPATPAAVVATLEGSIGSGIRVLDAGTRGWTALGPDGTVLAGAALETGPDAHAALRTTTGVSLRAAGATRLRLSTSSDVSLERGAIYIDNPGPDAARASLVVRTPFGVVREVGTQFEVRLDDAALRVRVREGAVALERDRRTDTATAGIELRVESGGAVERRQIPISGSDWAWVVGVAQPMAIEGTRLEEFLGWATREMGWRLSYADEALERELSGTILHGSIAGLTPAEAVESVLATCGLTYRVQNGTLTIQESGRKVR